ncbi:MAG: transposase [Candidatus Methanoperedens sp.]|nr:transposase [Candidatus Methanoperedens sp.]
MDYFASTSFSKLEKMIEKEKGAAIRQKLLVVWHKKRGATERDIEDILLVPRSTVGYLVRKFKKEGIKGFQRKPGSGGHNKYLTKEQEKELQVDLKKQPMPTKEVLVRIAKKYKKQYHPNSIPRLLKRLGQSLITPRKRHYKANPRSG